MLLQLLLPSIHFLWMEREGSVMNIKKVAISFFISYQTSVPNRLHYQMLSL